MIELWILMAAPREWREKGAALADRRSSRDMGGRPLGGACYAPLIKARASPPCRATARTTRPAQRIAVPASSPGAARN